MGITIILGLTYVHNAGKDTCTCPANINLLQFLRFKLIPILDQKEVMMAKSQGDRAMLNNK
jgi:hypothetical protein